MITEINETLVKSGKDFEKSIGKALRGRSIWIEGIRRSEWARPEVTPATDIQGDLRAFVSADAGFTVNSYELQCKAHKSDPICIADIREPGQLVAKVSEVLKDMENVLSHIWRQRGVHEYTRLAEVKAVLTQDHSWGKSEFPAVMPTEKLNQNALAVIHAMLHADGADLDGGAYDMVDGKPRFALVGDHDTPDFEGFVTIKETFPTRWKLVDQQWVEILPYLSEKTEKGTMVRINPEYYSASVQDTPIFLPTVMEFQVPRPIGLIGQEFDPMAYAAAVMWLNIPDTNPDSRHYNPDGNKGFFRALMQVATKPLRPEHGVVIRHLR